MNDWPIQFTNSISYTTIGLFVLSILLFIVVARLRAANQRLNHRISRLENEFRAMNSGHLGMGREIRRVFKEIANVEEKQQFEHGTETDEKVYDQAGLLLSRGATIEEVVEACEITPAEAELLAIMRHSAPSYKKHLEPA